MNRVAINMKKTSLLFLLLITLFSNPIKAFELSDSCAISLITCSPGNELYSAFGHSGIRIVDYKQDFDYIFNYGTFDFNQPNFYTNFMKGKMWYAIGVDDFYSFYKSYEFEQRDIFEQKLALSTEEIKKTFAFLDENLKPENKFYRYDFLNDNCSTRLLDVFNKNCNKPISLNYSQFGKPTTYRNLINEYSQHLLWEQLGMNLLIGAPVDKTIPYSGNLFLPDYLMKGMNGATFQQSNTKIAAAPTLLLKAYQTIKQTFFSQPNLVLGLFVLLFVLLIFVEIKRRKTFKLADILVFSLFGLIGCLFASMWLFTEHYTTYWNYNLLWANPVTLLVVFLLFFKNKKPFTIGLTIVGLLLAIFWIGNYFIPQQFIFPIYLLALLVSLRVLVNFIVLKNNNN